ncbi:MAG: hypothetical protein IJW31_09835 [Lentisphaeria bacterium]|nr:hypothetical protein [Lentisphaeria bacterium]
MKKLTVFTTMISSALILSCGCATTDFNAISQADEQQITLLEYQIANTSIQRTKLDLACKILDIDYQNKIANSILHQLIKENEYRTEITDKFHHIAENNLDNQSSYSIAKYFLAQQQPKPQLTKINELSNKFFLYNIENEKFDKVFFYNFGETIYGCIYDNIEFGNFDFALKSLDAIENIYTELEREHQIYFDLNATLCYFKLSKYAPAPKYFWNKNLKKTYLEKSNFYLDRIINQREEYLRNEYADVLVQTLAAIDQFELALNMADDYKNIEGIEEEDKMLLRIAAIAYTENHHKVLELLKTLKQSKFDQIYYSLIENAKKVGDYDYAIQIAEEAYRKKPNIFNAILLYDSLIGNNEFDKAEKILAENQNNLLIFYSLKMSKELNTRKFTADLQTALSEIISDKDFFSKKWQEPDTQAFVNQLLNYLSIVKNQKILAQIYANMPNTPKFYLNKHLLNSLGYTMAECDFKLLEAEAFITHAYLLDPNEINTLDSLAWVSYKLGKFEEAKKLIDKLLQAPDFQIHDNSPGCMYLHAGDIYRANNLEVEAVKFYEKAANFEEDAFFRYDDLKKRFTK